MRNQDCKIKIFLPSIANALFLSIFFYLVFIGGEILLRDGDTGYHIRAGEFILHAHSVPKTDMFSFISPALPWTAHEWLSEIMMALIHQRNGLTGVVIFFAFLIALTYFFLFQMIKSEGNIILAVMIMLLCFFSSMSHFLARPHIFSLLFTVLWYQILDRYQYKNQNRLYLLPLMMLVWVNLHGGFIAGFLILGIYIAGNLAQSLFDKTPERKTFFRKTTQLTLIMLACLFVTGINPSGYKILLFPFKLVSSKILMNNVLEFLSPDFHGVVPYRYLLFLMIALFAISQKRLNIIELGLVILFTHMSLYSARYITLFGIILAPILVKQSREILDKWDSGPARRFQEYGKRIASMDALSAGYVWAAVAIALAVILSVTDHLHYGFNPKKKPVAAAEFLQKENIPGNMFNNDEIGDYLIYKTWPQYKVFIDGRGDMYGDKIAKDYLEVVRIKPHWHDMLDKYKVDWIILDAGTPLSLLLLETTEWKLIYADKVTNIFLKNIPQNQSRISKYSNVKPVPVSEN